MARVQAAPSHWSSVARSRPSSVWMCGPAMLVTMASIRSMISAPRMTKRAGQRQR